MTCIGFIETCNPASVINVHGHHVFAQIIEKPEPKLLRGQQTVFPLPANPNYRIGGNHG